MSCIFGLPFINGSLSFRQNIPEENRQALILISFSWASMYSLEPVWVQALAMKAFRLARELPMA